MAKQKEKRKTVVSDIVGAVSNMATQSFSVWLIKLMTPKSKTKWNISEESTKTLPLTLAKKINRQKDNFELRVETKQPTQTNYNLFNSI